MRHERSRQRRLAVVCTAKCGGESFAADPLQQIAGRAARERGHDVIRALRAAEDDDQCLGRGLGDSADRGQAVAGKLDLEQEDVRSQTGGRIDRGIRVAGLGDDDEAVCLERLTNAAPVSRVVIGNENRRVLDIPPVGCT